MNVAVRSECGDGTSSTASAASILGGPRGYSTATILHTGVSDAQRIGTRGERMERGDRLGFNGERVKAGEVRAARAVAAVAQCNPEVAVAVEELHAAQLAVLDELRPEFETEQRAGTLPCSLLRPPPAASHARCA